MTWLLLLSLRLPATPARGQDFCVSCHRDAADLPAVAHGFDEWESSVHAKSGLSCAGCHAGDPRRPDKEAAHAGLNGSRDPASPLYYTRVSDSCGRCHARELAAFKKSSHYKELRRAGRGPNCVTCHGSMANRVMSPRDLERTCALCHRKPTEAFAARMALEEGAAAVRGLGAALQGADEARAEVRGGKAELARLLELERDAIVRWHAYDMEGTRGDAREIIRRAAGARARIAAAPGKEKP